MKTLLNSVNLIVSKYKEIERLTGEHYNIFSVMGMESNEVKTHSAIIGDLLNTKGIHLMGDVFLKLFIETIKNQSESQKLKGLSFDSHSSNCFVEEFVGQKKVEEIIGGRIDLVIKNSRGDIIIIENKIFAPEQENQIQRYKNAYPNGTILYLTLDRKDSLTAGDLVVNEDYHLICYEKTIINWLELCLKETFNQPILRETLKQYIVLIKKLTNQTKNIEMSKEITEIIKENFEASSEVYSNYEKALLQIENEYLDQLKQVSEKSFQDWKVSINDFKSTNALELKKGNILIRYRIKNHKQSTFHIEGIDSINKNLLGFTEKNSDKLNDNAKLYWFLQYIEVRPEMINNVENSEVFSKIKNIVQFV